MMKSNVFSIISRHLHLMPEKKEVTAAQKQE